MELSGDVDTKYAAVLGKNNSRSKKKTARSRIDRKYWANSKEED